MDTFCFKDRFAVNVCMDNGNVGFFVLPSGDRSPGILATTSAPQSNTGISARSKYKSTVHGYSCAGIKMYVIDVLYGNGDGFIP